MAVIKPPARINAVPATGSDTAARFNAGIPRATAAPTSRPIKASTALDNASTPKDWPRTEPTDESLSRWYEILSAANAMGNIHTGHVAQRPVLNPVSVPVPVPALDCPAVRSEEHTSELQSRGHLVCRLLLETKTPRALGLT